MPNIVVPRTSHMMSDDATESQIRGRLSLVHHDLGFGDAVPDAGTVWLVPGKPDAGRRDRRAPCRPRRLAEGQELSGDVGQIIDASVIAALRQSYSDVEKAVRKQRRIPEELTAEPSRLAQQDRDARWRMTGAQARPAMADGRMAAVAIPLFGYRTPVTTDRKRGFVCRPTVTSAAAHDGIQPTNVLDPADNLERFRRIETRPVMGPG